MRKRKTIIEGVFASLDRLGWERCKLRSLWKVDCEGFLAALAHNILKAIRRLTQKARWSVTILNQIEATELAGAVAV